MGSFETSKMYKKGSPELSEEEKKRAEKARLERLANAPESKRMIENLQKDIENLHITPEEIEEQAKAGRFKFEQENLQQ